MNSPEAARPEESLHRVTASGSCSVPLLRNGTLSLTALWGRNLEAGHASDSALAEASFDLAVDLGLVPGSLESQYGTRVPVGAFVFIGLQPPPMRAAHEHQHEHHHLTDM